MGLITEKYVLVICYSLLLKSTKHGRICSCNLLQFAIEKYQA